MLALKIALAAFVAVLVPVYWRTYGPSNFLWVSDIGLFLTVAAVWVNHPLPLGMAVLTALPFEVAWTADYAGRLLSGKRVLGVTDYMFDPELRLFVRALSLFHLVVPVLWFGLLLKLGYDPRTLRYQIPLFAAITILTLALTDPHENINWVFLPQARNWSGAPFALWVALYLTMIPLLVFWPLHLLLLRWFAK